MPKGTKLNAHTPPAMSYCDFCTRQFKPLAWNERTCFSCEQSGAPNQSKLDWSVYQRALAKFLRAIGRRAPLSGAALNPTTTLGRLFPRVTQTL